jgi:hypothetical protein
MTAHEALVAYCAAQRCETCPLNTPELGCIEDGDRCVLSHALEALPADSPGIDPAYEAMRADLGQP